MNLDLDEQQRYSRHLMLPEIGLLGQIRLKSSSVLLIGMGGLGSAAGLYLAACGVGRLGLVDFDKVDTANLHRQVLYGPRDVGEAKVKRAALRLKEQNPNLGIAIYQQRLSIDNAAELIAQFDVVVDGSDNFATRYLINDACFFERKPLVYGSVHRFFGEATVFHHRHGPCYRCMFRSELAEEAAPSCSRAGVLGVLPGIMGTIQACEAIKLILGSDGVLAGQLLTVDALAMQFRKIAFTRNPQCPLCGAQPTIHDLKHAPSLCQAFIPEITLNELSKWRRENRSFFLLDVREPQEYRIKNLGGYLIPLADLDGRRAELPAEQCIVVHCQSGARSLKACERLKAAGFTDVWNLSTIDQ